MRTLQDLIYKTKPYTKSYDHTIYIVGTGPSLRLIDPKFFHNKLIIGLNEAYKAFKNFDPNLIINITIHPELIPKDRSLLWLTKPKNNIDVSKHYIFKNTEDLEILKPPPLGVPDNRSKMHLESLYCSRGIQTAGLHLASILGAVNAILVGCDMSAIGCDHHSEPDAHVQFHNLNFNDVYKEYYYYTTKVKELLFKYYGMNTYSLSPLIGECCREQDYYHQLEFYGLKPHPKPKEIETAKRTTKLVKDYL